MEIVTDGAWFNTPTLGNISFKNTQVFTESSAYPATWAHFVALSFLARFHYERKLSSRCLHLTSFLKRP